MSSNCVGFILIKDSDTRVAFNGNPSLELDDMVRFKTQDCELYGEKILHMERTVIPDICEEQEFLHGKLAFWGQPSRRAVCENIALHLTPSGKV